MLSKPNAVLKKTKEAILVSSLCFEPLSTLLTWLPFILRKDMTATATQIAVLSALKPTLTFASFYLTSSWKKSADFLRSNLFLTGFAARLPFLLFPFINSSWFYAIAAPLFFMFNRAGNPAWMEIIKRNIDKSEREKAYSLGSILGYAEGVLLSFAMGLLLDQDPKLWKLFIFFAAVAGLIGVYIQSRLPINVSVEEEKEVNILSFKEALLKPWKDTISLMKDHKEFAFFQWSFMIGGFGVMLMIPVVPLYFVDCLHITHVDNAFAKSVCMGLGFILTTPLWIRAIKKYSLNLLTCIVCMSFAIFPVFLLFSQTSVILAYIAYFFYGLSQGGSHLVWNLSGPLFAGEKESSVYSGVNLMMVGVRGLIAPILGASLYANFGGPVVFSLGGLLCLFGGLLMARKAALKKVPTT